MMPENNLELEEQDNLHANKRIRRRLFTKDDDQKLIKFISKYGTNNWNKVSKEMNDKTPRQCKERWLNYLSPENKFTPWTNEEDNLLVSLINEVGTKWVMLTKSFFGRSDNSIKNHWYSVLKKLCGIDTKGEYFIDEVLYRKRYESIKLSKKEIKKRWNEKLKSQRITQNNCTQTRPMSVSGNMNVNIFNQVQMNISRNQERFVKQRNEAPPAALRPYPQISQETPLDLFDKSWDEIITGQIQEIENDPFSLELGYFGEW